MGKEFKLKLDKKLNSLGKELKKLEKQLKDLNREIKNNSQNIIKNKKISETSDSPKKIAIAKNNIIVYDEFNRRAKVKRVDVEFRIKDVKATIETTHYIIETLRPFYETMKEKIKVGVDVLGEIIVKEETDISTGTFEDIYNYWTKNVDNIRKEDLEPFASSNVTAWITRWRNVLHWIGEVGSYRRTRGDQLARSLKAGKVNLFAKLLQSECQGVLEAIDRKMFEPSKWDKIKGILSNGSS